MIYDRTQADVDLAKQLRAKLQNDETLTDEEIAQLEKGTLTINTLNRIEEKTEELKGLLDSDSYFSGSMTFESWEYSVFFKQANFNRIVNNANALRKAYFTHNSTPEISNNNYREYKTINELEFLLYDLETMIDDVKSYYRECGTFECGGE